MWGRRGVDLAKWLVINWVKLADTKSDLSGDTDVSGTYYSIGGFLGGHYTSGSG